ncbi:Tm-1-like ATP-binding domain-containing protein [Paenibacillus thalictri]|uniref:UPF0261 family protein n=1 Tax=Paenibacillus thalictri TaxID=2527873 RepID=A0A4Q9DLF3_9BACL|nr:Tm-1-like ATP-binding domain-containing protein [Paenibacillus thalictri]TBL75250.1 UPF0261 family protein [Paenibacillus thalictri]
MSIILMIGTFDTKEEEFVYLRERLMACGHGVLSVNVGVMATSGQFPVEIDAAEIAQAAGADLHVLRGAGNRDRAMEVMCNGAAIVVQRLYQAGRFQAIIGMGGGGGTAIVTASMRELPYGVPKVCVSTVASGNVSGYVGIKDIVMIPSLTDLAGIHPISRMVIAQAAGAVCGMVEAELPLPSKGNAPVIAATMFGNTTACVQACACRLREQGYQVLIFHATGTGGKMMESLIEEGYIDAVLDLTTTEIADELCGGMMSAGPGRLSAAGRRGIPQVVAPGCLDMVNFGVRESIPVSRFKEGRVFYSWNPNNTLMRTSSEDNLLIGEQIALRLNASQGPVKVMLPLRGLSILGEEGQPFYDPQADGVLFSVMRNKLKPDIEIIEMDMAINESAFADKAVQLLLELIGNHNGS